MASSACGGPVDWEPQSSATERRRSFFRDGVAVEIGLGRSRVFAEEVEEEESALLPG
jgi:hypothetical protein